MRKNHYLLAAFASLAVCSERLANATVILNDGGTTTLEVVARDTNVSFSNTITDLFPSSLPYSASEDATVGTSSSHAAYSLSATSFTIAASGERNGRLDSRANVQPTMYFSVDVNTPYSLSGALNVNDPNNTGKYASLGAILTDLTTSGVVYSSVQESFGAVDASFVLGGNAGNVSNSNSGSPTGTLVAGHQYSLYYVNSIYAANSGDPATFTGSFEFNFGSENSVPDTGSTMFLLALGGLSLAVFRRKQSSLA